MLVKQNKVSEEGEEERANDKPRCFPRELSFLTRSGAVRLLVDLLCVRVKDVTDFLGGDGLESETKSTRRELKLKN